MNKVHLVTGDDWQGLYINGELVFEDSGFLRAFDALAHVASLGQFELNWFTLSAEAEDKLIDEGTLPNRLKDVIK